MSKIKIKRYEIEKVFQEFDGFCKEPSYNKFFSFFSIRNIQHLLPEANSVNELRKMLLTPDRVKEYEDNRKVLIERYADRDSDGKLIEEELTSPSGLRNMKYTFTKTLKEFEAELKALTEYYKSDLESYDKSIKEYYILMDEEIEIEVAKIAFKNIPDNIDIKNLVPFINESLEEIETLLLG